MVSFQKVFRSPGLLTGMGVMLVAAAASSRPFWPGELARFPWMTFLRDDFFYYLVIARHLAMGQGSTFNGIVATNGYHPLWMLLLAVVCRISTSPFMVLGFVALTAMLSTVAAYGLALRLFEHCGVTGWMGALSAAYVALCVLPLCFYGMEVTLAMPLALALGLHVLRWSHDSGTRWWLVAGLLTSLLVLARVDALLLATLLAVALLSVRQVRMFLCSKHLAALAAGCTPAIGYFVASRLYFGLWLPVSGVAKQLRQGWTPAVSVWASVLDGPRSAWLNLLLVVIAIGLTLWRWRQMAALERAVLAVFLAYPFLFVLLLSVRSDWEMWPWYAWVWRPATFAALAIALGAALQPVRSGWAHSVLLVLVLMRVAGSAWLPGQLDFYRTAVAVQAFAKTHPGTYAMGDRAGMIAWLLPDPLVQTEGLVMDRSFLKHIQRQDALLPVLRSYGVRYYIADDWAGGSLIQGQCFVAQEPAEAGPESPRMRATLCDAPRLRVTNNQVTTMIFALPPDASTLRRGDGER